MAAKTGTNSDDDKRAPEDDDRRAPEYKDADRRVEQQTNQDPDARTVVPATRTRQAIGGHNVRYVLVFGLAAVIIVFIVIYLVYFT
jgi:hypothetical protein